MDQACPRLFAMQKLADSAAICREAGNRLQLFSTYAEDVV
jgi:hypothetical protein